jgi:hypothetical protein
MAAKGLAISGLFPISRTPDLHVIEFDAVFTRAPAAR